MSWTSITLPYLLEFNWLKLNNLILSTLVIAVCFWGRGSLLLAWEEGPCDLWEWDLQINDGCGLLLTKDGERMLVGSIGSKGREAARLLWCGWGCWVDFQEAMGDKTSAGQRTRGENRRIMVLCDAKIKWRKHLSPLLHAVFMEQKTLYVVVYKYLNGNVTSTVLTVKSI